MPTPSPDGPALRAIVAELYTLSEAELVAAMPVAPSTLTEICALAKQPSAEVSAMLEALCHKGLVIDLFSEREQVYRYTPCPYVVGIFEFTMMRTASPGDHRRRAALFEAYYPEFLAANLQHGEQVSIARTLPHEPALPQTISGPNTEILDYERASQIIDQADVFSVGTCSCRQEKRLLHPESASHCQAPLESCTSLGPAASYLIRNGLAREITRDEMRAILERSRKLGLVLCADNVQNGVGFICHCCSCCCNLLRGVTEYGYPNTIVTSNFIAQSDDARCTGCGVCAKACPVDALAVDAKTTVDTSLCLGCGVCVFACKRDAMHLAHRPKRVMVPEATFERVVLSALEHGTLQQLVFDGPHRDKLPFLQGLLRGFLGLSVVKRAIMSDTLRSKFLAAITAAAKQMGKTGADVLPTQHPPLQP
jgi:Na+-translocating ferredoxin:NAD+ oxidoreductase RNF subunit RnfB